MTADRTLPALALLLASLGAPRPGVGSGRA